MENRSPQFHHRRSIRLPGYDYAQAGGYFITLVTGDRACLFGDIVNGQMALNPAGLLAEHEWHSLEKRFPGIELDAFQVMPNHIHGIIFLIDSTPSAPAPGEKIPKVLPGSLAAMVRSYNASVTLRYNRIRMPVHSPLWQRNYYEHIIRSTESLDKIRAYILNNPQQWADDQENPNR